jgi:hypothetical protein
MGLKINQEKTKFMLVILKKRERKATALTPLKVGEFEQVESFTYLATAVNTQNTIREEIKTRIMAANRSYFGLKSTLNPNYYQEQLKFSYIKPLLDQSSCMGRSAGHSPNWTSKWWIGLRARCCEQFMAQSRTKAPEEVGIMMNYTRCLKNQS